MKTLKFKCTLKTDIILNQKAASEGPNICLDFIPGNNFLGIVASKYQDFGEDTINVFHSGKVRFGDAHVAHGDNRTVHIPASYYYPKMEKMSDRCYVHHHISDKLAELKDVQLKQCRTGFYDFTQGADAEVEKVDIIKNFAIKSAYDKIQRRAKDSQMFGYQSMPKGLKFFFEIEIDEGVSDSAIKLIVDTLTDGDKRIGRSRTAQYGLVNIVEVDNYNQVRHGEINDDFVCVYADGRLIFLDDNLQPTFRPTAEQLGLKGGKILWDKCQIRTFQYAPWNFYRQTFDNDRCGIEKGSVFVVKVPNCDKLLPNYIGSYKNEGFGRVIYNPEFLGSAEGKCLHKFKENKKPEKTETERVKLQILPEDSALVAYLKGMNNQTNIYELVEKWVSEYGKLFVGDDKFASQWGEIRSRALKHDNDEKFFKDLFDTETIYTFEDGRKRPEGKGYLMHGEAKKRWDKNNRQEKLKKILNDNKSNAREIAINLANTMRRYKPISR